MTPLGRAALPLLIAPLALAACNKPKRYTTTVLIEQVQQFGQDPKVPGVMDLDLKFIDCPGNQHRIMRGDKTFSACGGKFKAGTKVEAELVLAFSAKRGNYRSEIVRLGDCAVKLDPNETANYEMIQQCTDLTMSGSVVGVHCNRRRTPELLAKCPFFRRD